mgnify:CR=1 FL=1
MDEITKEQIAQHYTALGHSVGLINDIIAEPIARPSIIYKIPSSSISFPPL